MNSIKTTFNLNTSLKQEMSKIKDETGHSLSFLLNEAVAKYLDNRELKKWIDGTKKASHNKEYPNLWK